MSAPKLLLSLAKALDFLLTAARSGDGYRKDIYHRGARPHSLGRGEDIATQQMDGYAVRAAGLC